MVFRSTSSLCFMIIIGSRAYCLTGNNNASTYIPTSSSFVKFKVSSKFDQVVARSSLTCGIFDGQVRQKKTEFSELEFETLVRSCLSILSR